MFRARARPLSSSVDTSMEPEGSLLQHLLKKQNANYRRALVLERELSDLISKSDFKTIVLNTKRKQRLMAEVIKLHKQLEPVLQDCLGDRRRLSRPECEKLRLEALSLLDEIGKIEHNNLEAIRKSTAAFTNELRQVQKAKTFARGYKPSRSRQSRHIDTEG